MKLIYRTYLNTNLTNLSNAMECVNFFPPRITRMLTKFAVLIAFESFARFVQARIELFLQVAFQRNSIDSKDSC